MKNFVLNLTIKNISSIKPREGGDSKIDGQDVKWGYAVKVKVRNIDTIPDQKFGEKDIETTLEVEIPCTSLAETMKVNNLLKVMKSSKKEFVLPVGLSSRTNGSYACKSQLNGFDFLEKHKTQTKM